MGGKKFLSQFLDNKHTTHTIRKITGHDFTIDRVPMPAEGDLCLLALTGQSLDRP